MNKIYPILYKSNGKQILVWHLEQQNNKYRSISGILNGKLVISAWTECIGKNKGKKNETSNIDQTIKKVESLYNQKYKKMYVQTLEESKAMSINIRPMLAHTYYNETFNPETNECKIKSNIPSKKEFKEGILIEPKLDGIRCLANKKGMYSRTGASIDTLPHIKEVLNVFFEKHPNITLDGELYNHDMEFNTINGIVKRFITSDKTEEDIKLRNKIEYHVYDIVSNGTNYDRYKTLHFIISKFYYENPNLPKVIKLVKGNSVFNEEDVQRNHDLFVLQGYEGAMLRRENETEYKQGKRSKDLLKVKSFIDEEFIIKDVLEGIGNNKGLAAKLEVTSSQNSAVVVYPNMTGSWEFCKKVFENKQDYIGKVCTVKFFGYTPDGSLRFPTVKFIYKDNNKI